MEHTRGTISSRRLVIAIRFPVATALNDEDAANSYADNVPRERRLNFRRMRLYTHFLLRAVPRQGRTMRRETRIMNAKGFRLLQGAPKGRGCASHAGGSRY